MGYRLSLWSGPPAPQGKRRSMLRPYDLTHIYPFQAEARGRGGVELVAGPRCCTWAWSRLQAEG